MVDSRNPEITYTGQLFRRRPASVESPSETTQQYARARARVMGFAYFDHAQTSEKDRGRAKIGASIARVDRLPERTIRITMSCRPSLALEAIGRIAMRH